MTLDRVEDLLSGFKQMLAFLVDDLVHNKKEMEALGIYTRNELQGYVKPETEKELSTVVYDRDKDTSIPQQGELAPVSQPVTDYCQLPGHVNIKMIDTDEDCKDMEELLDEPFIGVDSEWRPELT